MPASPCRRSWIAGAPLLISVFAAALAIALPPNQFADLYSSDPAAYNLCQMKFVYLGSQKKIVTSLAVCGPGRTFDLLDFAAWEVDYPYVNNRAMGDTIVLAGPDWQFFMDSILARPSLSSTARITNPNCSVMIQTDIPTPRCWEHPATRAETDSLFQLLEDSVSDPAHKITIAAFRRQMAGVRR